MHSELPFDVWVQIFLWADYKSLDNCRKTCRAFFEILQGDSFWIERSRFTNCSDVLPPPKWRTAALVGEFPDKETSLDASSFKFNYKTMVMSGKGFKKTLLFEIQPGVRISQRTIEGMRHTAGGNGIETEGNDSGCNPSQSVQNCYAFSFGLSTIYFAINFSKWGIDDWILDHVRPKIRVSMKVNHRYDCGAEVFLGAELNYRVNHIKHDPRSETRDQVNETRYKREFRRWEQWTEADWEDISIEFDIYPSRLRNMMIMISGKDTQFWAGFFGPKIANVEVELIMPTEVSLKNFKEDNEKTTEDENDTETPENGNLLENIRRMIPVFRGQRWSGRHRGQQVFPP